MRHGDLPAHKNTIMSGLCGRGEEFVKLRGLTKNKEYIINVRELAGFESAKSWLIMIDRLSDDVTLNLQFKALDLSVHIVKMRKSDDSIIRQESLNGLRYNISNFSNLELTSGSQDKFDRFFELYKNIYFECFGDDING